MYFVLLWTPGGSPFLKNQEPRGYIAYSKTPYKLVSSFKIKQYMYNFNDKNISIDL
jgi:hypothetical protein